MKRGQELRMTISYNFGFLIFNL